MSTGVEHCGVRTASLLLLIVSLQMIAANRLAAAEAGTRAANTALCESCHGAKGEGDPEAGVPVLAGQSVDYLEKQLRDYESGTRDNPIMRNFAKGLSDSERAQLSRYYASLSAPAPHAVQVAPMDQRQWARGQQLAHQGAEAERVQGCNNCHGPDGSGLPHSAPYLAGQSAKYLAIALKSWQQGTRKNDSGQLMVSVAKQLSADDIAAVSDYFSSLKVAKN